jgi:hypothetical protein
MAAVRVNKVELALNVEEKPARPGNAGAAPTGSPSREPQEFSFTKTTPDLNLYLCGGMDYDLDYVPKRVKEVSVATNPEIMLERPPKIADDPGGLYSWSSSGVSSHCG